MATRRLGWTNRLAHHRRPTRHSRAQCPQIRIYADSDSDSDSDSARISPDPADPRQIRHVLSSRIRAKDKTLYAPGLKSRASETSGSRGRLAGLAGRFLFLQQIGRFLFLRQINILRHVREPRIHRRHTHWRSHGEDSPALERVVG